MAERYRIEVASENPFTDSVVASHAQALAEELDFDGTNQGSVVVVDADGVEVTGWRFPADDPPEDPRRIRFMVDSGDHEVGKLRYRFDFSGDGEPTAALDRAIRAWLAATGDTGIVSMTEALDLLPDEYLAGVGLMRITDPHCEEIDVEDHLIGGD